MKKFINTVLYVRPLCVSREEMRRLKVVTDLSAIRAPYISVITSPNEQLSSAKKLLDHDTVQLKMISPFILIVILISFVFGLTNHLVVAASINDDHTNNEDTNNTNDDDDEYLQPEVHRYTNVLPREVCDEIIRLGEDAGFPLEEDSIDDNQENNKSSQAIDVMTEAGQVKYPKIFNALKPYIPDIARLIMKQRDPVMDSILFPQ